MMEELFELLVSILPLLLFCFLITLIDIKVKRKVKEWDEHCKFTYPSIYNKIQRAWKDPDYMRELLGPETFKKRLGY